MVGGSRDENPQGLGARAVESHSPPHKKAHAEFTRRGLFLWPVGVGMRTHKRQRFYIRSLCDRYCSLLYSVHCKHSDALPCGKCCIPAIITASVVGIVSFRLFMQCEDNVKIGQKSRPEEKIRQSFRKTFIFICTQ